MDLIKDAVHSEEDQVHSIEHVVHSKRERLRLALDALRRSQEVSLSAGKTRAASQEGEDRWRVGWAAWGE